MVKRKRTKAENVKLKPKIFNDWGKAVDYSDELLYPGMATDTLVIPIVQ